MNTDAGEKFFLGLVVGTVLGITIGLLNAPRPGTETQQLIKERLDTAGNRVKEGLDSVGNRIKEARGKAE